jgi:hypothetical protein
VSPNAFVKRLLAVLGEPGGSDPAAFLSEYIRILGSYRPDVVALASDLVVDTESFWPRPAELRRHLGTATTRLYPRTPEPVAPERPPLTDDEKARADALMRRLRTQLGTAKAADADAPRPLADVTRDAFAQMQQMSRTYLHRRGRP